MQHKNSLSKKVTVTNNKLLTTKYVAWEGRHEGGIPTSCDCLGHARSCLGHLMVIRSGAGRQLGACVMLPDTRHFFRLYVFKKYYIIYYGRFILG